MAQEKKHLDYATAIIGKIQELFDDEFESDFHIDTEELESSENLKHFIHALSNIASTYIFNDLIGDKKEMLEFNHLANRLVFEYSKK